MAETIEQFVARKRRELDTETARLKAELEALDAEREKLDRVATFMKIADVADSEWPESGDHTATQKRTAATRTIKEMVMDVLRAHPEGLPALDILSEINKERETPFPRTSLSPQLSRLKASGEVRLEGRTWVVNEQQSQSEDETSIAR